jgi:hypothetical protein
MTNHDIDKAYVSPYDQFLAKFDATHEKSESQLQEINKHRLIFEHRDQAIQPKVPNEIWTDF